jgi:uncharacterized 2Fe-2S/4Fe-4S cluster protein (DUF4445 family)
MSHLTPTKTLTLTFPQVERALKHEHSDTLYQAARRGGIRIVGACGGRGTCGTCRVRILEGEVDTSREKARLGERTGWLRACQVTPLADCVIEIAERSLAPVVRTEFDHAPTASDVPPDPAVVSADVTVPAATLTDNVSDFERVARALPIDASTIDLEAARQLPAALRQGDWSLRVHVRDGELIGLAPAGRRSYGLAIDLGTTNVAGFLVDLETGRRVASLGIENPQAAWGADVISRMNHAMQDEAALELRQAAAAAINSLAHDLCASVDATAADIVDVAICGNTAMHHLLLGLPVRQLGRAPFVAATRDAADLKARELGLAICPGAYVHVAPNIGGFVGSDHVTALLATEDRWRDRTALVMDIGTNTEISLVHDGEIHSASCPSGPALEGGHISCGMRAAEGAIECVRLADGRITVDVIGGGKPVGLCGSGVIDAVATLRDAQIIDIRGRIAGRHPDIVEAEGGRAAAIAPDVHFTQHDVRAVQLAKAAIRTGLELLLRDRGLEENDIDRIVVAGAFGAYIDLTSAIAIGLVPPLPLEKFEQVGNAAGLGIRQMLASRQARTEARELARRCKYVELSTRSDFQKTFIANIGFKAQANLRRAS